MSRFGIVPLFHPFSGIRDPFDASPARLFDQHFGVGLGEADTLPSYALQNYYVRPKPLLKRQDSGVSEVRSDPSKFQVMLDVNQFTPEEITVKTVDNAVVVIGKHEEKMDEHGYVSREFQRRYVLPDNVEPQTVTSSLSHDGILTVEAPRKSLEPIKANERVVTIVRKDTPAVTQSTGQTPEPTIKEAE